jgi:hypothetical protein
MEVLTQFIFAEMDFSRRRKVEMEYEQKALLKKGPTNNLDQIGQSTKKKNAGDGDGTWEREHVLGFRVLGFRL